MEKKENPINKPGKSHSSNIKKMFGGRILGILLLGSCQENKDKVQESQGNKIENIGDTTEETGIQEPWEYKVYKLGLGSIAPVKGDIQKAKTKISNTPELSRILNGENIEFEAILPSIIKESMMDNSARSNSGAVGYFQLKPIAVKDVEKHFGIENLKLNANNPVDNVILGSLYRIRSLNLLKEGLKTDLSDNDLEKMMILSYNVGAARVKKLFKESKTTNYKDFERYLAKKIGVKKSPTKRIDRTYGVDYMDPLTDLNLNNLKTQEYKKIAEGLRYVAIIDGISGYIKANNTIQILGKITYDKNKSLFSVVKDLRNQGVFKKDSSINDICKIILETNGYSEKETPTGVDLLLIKDALIDYLP